MANQGREQDKVQKRGGGDPMRYFILAQCFSRLPRSQLISLQLLSGPSASKQPFTQPISLKTTLSSRIVHQCVCKKPLVYHYNLHTLAQHQPQSLISSVTLNCSRPQLQQFFRRRSASCGRKSSPSAITGETQHFTNGKKKKKKHILLKLQLNVQFASDVLDKKHMFRGI